MPARTILVVDDDEVLCRMIRRGLEPLGYKVEALDATEPTLRRFSEGGVDAVLLDLLLGRESGLEALRLIRKEGGTPVFLMTGTVVDNEMEKYVRAIGAQGIFRKPFEFAELAARLKGVLEGGG